ncbi:MAG TPA: glycerate kinase [Lacunisphaera sp.]|jgi:glycerate kinase
MKRVLIAFDKFKDAISAHEACEAATRGLHSLHPDWSFDLCPLTDGGEGFCASLTTAAQGGREIHLCTGPRGTMLSAPVGFVQARNLSESTRSRLGFGASGSGSLAVVEMAAASGLALLPKSQRDPWHTSSYGTGDLLRAAVQRGVDSVLLGVGGSATNDLGLGALAALGFKFLDAEGMAIANPTPATWEKIQQIDQSAAISLPPLFIACDVTNQLLGPTGATAVFGPQKGLRADDAPRLEIQAQRLAALLCTACDQSNELTAVAGTGAAGGIAFGLMAACRAKLIPGFPLVSDWLALPARIATADLVLTGEGRFDTTSLGGKGPGALIALAREAGKPVHLFAGSLEMVMEEGRSFHAITPPGMLLSEALPRTAELLEAAVRGTFAPGIR